MELQQLQSIKKELSQKKRRLFHYAPDHYAIYLLGRWLSRGPRTVAETRASSYGRLLDRPRIKAGLKDWGDGLITQQRLAMLQAAEPAAFRISFSHWGNPKHRWANYDQTSRPGYNLVVQLNFSGLHNKVYLNLLPDKRRHPFRYYCHPVRSDDEFTLAWARIDIAEDRSAALIEEIQSDWWKEAQREVYERCYKKRDAKGRMREWTEKHSRHQIDIDAYEKYLHEVLTPYGKLWPEAILTAALQVLQEELGIAQIFYHEYASGCFLKNCSPPRSLYTTVPKRFCFEPTKEVPAFLHRHIQRSRKLRQQVLSFWMLE